MTAAKPDMTKGNKVTPEKHEPFPDQPPPHEGHGHKGKGTPPKPKPKH